MRSTQWIVSIGFMGLMGNPLMAVTPEAESKPDKTPEVSSQKPDPAVTTLDPRILAELALEHSRARDSLLAAESRLSLLAEKLFGSRLVVQYEGFLDTPFRLAVLELDLDGALAYRKEFKDAPTAEVLKLYDGFLPPGRHVLRLRIEARGPDDVSGGHPGYFAGSGLSVHLRAGATTEARFIADQDGDPPPATVLKETEPEGNWDIEIEASFETKSP